MIRDSATSQVLGIENNANLTGTKVILEANDGDNESSYHYWIRSVSDSEGFFTLTNSGTGKVLTVLDSGVVISGMYVSFLKRVVKVIAKGRFFSEDSMGLKKICQITILNLKF